MGTMPKMTFEQRCTALALMRNYASIRGVMEMFGVSNATLLRLRDGHGDYKLVLDEWQRLGPARFTEKYLTEDVLAQLPVKDVRRIKRFSVNMRRPAT